MGTKVHCKSYFPGYYSMRDINEDKNSSWPRYYEDRALNGQFCNGFTPRSLDGYLDYDREILKQTMLRHEEIFKKQVLELHRLYKKQRDLMEELKRNGEGNFSMQVKPFQSSPFSTQVLPSGIEKSLQLHGFPSKSAGCSREPISGVEASKTHQNSPNGSNFEAGLISRKNGGPQVNQLPDSRVRKLPKKMLDLELPADAYIDDEDVDCAVEKNVTKSLFGSTDPSKRNHGFESQNNVNLTLGAPCKRERIYQAQGPCTRDEAWRSSSDLQNGLQHNLADLNEPLKDVSCEEVGASSSKFPVQRTYSQGIQGQHRSMESVSSFRGHRKDVFHDRNNGRDRSISLHMERGDEELKWPFFNGEAGQSSSHVSSSTSSLCSKHVRPLSGPFPINPSKTQDCLSMFPPRQDKTESWFRENQYHGIEPCDRSHHTANKAYSGLMVPATSSPHYAPPAIDYAKTGSQAVLRWKNPSNSISHMPTAFQAFPFYGASTPTNIQASSLHDLEGDYQKWQRTHDFTPTPKGGGEPYLYPDGFCHGFQFKSTASVHLSSASFNKPNLNNIVSTSYEKSEGHGCQISLNGSHGMDVKTAKGVNLNLAPPNGILNGFGPKLMPVDAEGKKEGLRGGIPWLRTKTPCREPLRTDKGVLHELSSVWEHSQPMPSAMVVAQKAETEVSSSFAVTQHLPSVLKARGTEIRLNEAAATVSNSKIFGFSAPQRTQQTDVRFTSISPQKVSLGDDEVKNMAKQGLIPADSSHHSEPLDLEKQAHMELVQEKDSAETLNCFRGHINLNSSATSIDELTSPESPSEDEVKPASLRSIRGIAARFAPEIDLEAPPTALEEERAPSTEPASQIVQLVQPVEQESRNEVLQTTEILDEALAIIAAEAIHMISLSTPIHFEDAACRPLPTASSDTLHWFADLVVSTGDYPADVEAPNCLGDVDGEFSDVDGMDYFEYMTLNLSETRIDEFCYRPMEVEQPEEEETGVAHLLLTRPRRGQARRRRQRRDFQRDILPGLASLSRQEVTEDLQIIGGLMKASGFQWKAGRARRNAGRNRARRQARGGRRPRSTPATNAAAMPECPQPRQSNKQEAAINGRSIVGWGRTTKRCRRQRCPPGNILLPPPS